MISLNIGTVTIPIEDVTLFAKMSDNTCPKCGILLRGGRTCVVCGACVHRRVDSRQSDNPPDDWAIARARAESFTPGADSISEDGKSPYGVCPDCGHEMCQCHFCPTCKLAVGVCKCDMGELPDEMFTEFGRIPF